MQILFRAEIDETKLLTIEDIKLLEYINDKYYAIGHLNAENKIEIKRGKYIHAFKVKEETKSINFEDMLDSQGNKIFASLSADGKGGDICTRGNNEVGLVCCYKFAQLWFVSFGEKSFQNHSTTWTQYAYNKNDFFCSFNRINRERDYHRAGFRAIGIQE